MNQKELGGLRGEFCWLCGQEFIIVTPKGNFVWSDPGMAEPVRFSKPT